MSESLSRLKNDVLKLLLGILVSIVAWFTSQIYSSLQEIQRQFLIMDKRVTSIEVSRADTHPTFLKLQALVEEIKVDSDINKEKIVVIQSALTRHKIY